MINIEDKSTLSSKTLMISCDNQVTGNTYQLRMFQSNEMKAFLPMTATVINNIRECTYEVKDYISLKEKYENQVITKSEICGFVKSLKEAIFQLKRCLIDIDKIVLRTDCIFLRKNEFKFCFFSEYDESFDEGLKNVLEFFMERVDYDDKAAVLTVYEVYHKIVRDGCSLESIVFEDRVIEKSKVEHKRIIKTEVVEEIPSVDEMENNLKNIKSKDSNAIRTGLIAMTVVAAILILWEIFEIPIEKNIAFPIVIIVLSVGVFVKIKSLKKVTEDKKVHQPEDNLTVLLSPKDLIPSLIYEENGEEKRIGVDTFPFLIGSQKERVNLHIKSKSVSRIHARIFREQENLFVQDMNSTNGTSVNDRKLKANEVVQIEDDDIITMADVDMILKV